jgi:hypothetical protein
MLPQSVPCQTNALMCTLYCSYPIDVVSHAMAGRGESDNSPANRKRRVQGASQIHK